MSLHKGAKFLEASVKSFDFPGQDEARPFAAEDPLGEVIDWLGRADLTEEHSGNPHYWLLGSGTTDVATADLTGVDLSAVVQDLGDADLTTIDLGELAGEQDLDEAAERRARYGSSEEAGDEGGAVGGGRRLSAQQDRESSILQKREEKRSIRVGRDDPADVGKAALFPAELFTKEGRPRSPPASGDGPHSAAFRTSDFATLPDRAALPPRKSAICGIGEEEVVRVSRLDAEEREWDARQQRTGAAGRLVVYDPGDCPKADFMLRGGMGHRVMVSAVAEGGKAALAGVKAGDVLVSIDGKKDFREKHADDIYAALEGPVVLVFLGFTGKLQAEVRLNYKQKVAGLSSQHQVVYGRPDAPVQVVDEVIFQPGTATLLLATSPPGPWLGGKRQANGIEGDDGKVEEEPEEGTLDEGQPDPPSQQSSDAHGGPETLSAVYELRGFEARNLVSRALSKARTASSSLECLPPGSALPGIRAQVPHSSAPAMSPFAEWMGTDAEASMSGDPAKPFHFNDAASDETTKTFCAPPEWWVGKTCPGGSSAPAQRGQRAL